MWPAVPALPLSRPDRIELTRWAQAGTTRQRLAFRARLLLAATGWSNAALACELLR